MYKGINQAQLWQAQQQVKHSTSYPSEKQDQDDFMRKMRHALVNGNISAFKELTLQNQIKNYDYESYFIDRYKRGSLHLVCENGRVSLIRYFIEQKLFQINQKIGGFTPFILLTMYYIQTPEKCTTNEIIQLLLDAGADPLIKMDGNNLSVNDIIEQCCQKDEPLNMVMQFIKKIYFEKEREQAVKNLILLGMCDHQSDNNTVTDQLFLKDLCQIAEYIQGVIEYPIQQQIDQ